MDPQNGDKPQKQRSPAYPSDGLDKCVHWARQIYDAEKKAVMASAIAVKRMGYGAMSGTARTALSSMKKFGLLTEEGTERVRVSDDAVRLIMAPDEETKLQLLRKMAQRPDIIRELVADHPAGLPSDENLKYMLIAERGFGDQAAATFIKTLRETVKIARLGPAEYGSPVEPQRVARSEPPPPDDPPEQSQQSPRSSGLAKSSLKVELSDGIEVEIRATGPLTADTFDELLDYLKVYERVLKKKSGARSESEPS